VKSRMEMMHSFLDVSKRYAKIIVSLFNSIQTSNPSFTSMQAMLFRSELKVKIYDLRQLPCSDQTFLLN